ncbi:hypothetical protein TNCT_192331 [Trichonephila clavata]|uniref:Uncharacterized protein n=1 Tax=Trichonephila clavata TaxID=2740835 RepID=A0A8X6I0R1_TRICU|nr:hypothetical protein TNCT_192331 [Trichonephila clavata]
MSRTSIYAEGRRRQRRYGQRYATPTNAPSNASAEVQTPAMPLNCCRHVLRHTAAHTPRCHTATTSPIIREMLRLHHVSTCSHTPPPTAQRQHTKHTTPICAAAYTLLAASSRRTPSKRKDAGTYTLIR